MVSSEAFSVDIVYGITDPSPPVTATSSTRSCKSPTLSRPTPKMACARLSESRTGEVPACTPGSRRSAQPIRCQPLKTIDAAGLGVITQRCICLPSPRGRGWRAFERRVRVSAEMGLREWFITLPAPGESITPHFSHTFVVRRQRVGWMRGARPIWRRRHSRHYVEERNWRATKQTGRWPSSRGEGLGEMRVKQSDRPIDRSS